jgi:hypothetical protein
LSRIVLLIEKFRPTKSYQNKQLQTKTYIETYIEIRFAIVWGSSKKPKHANECSCFLTWQVKEKVLQQSLPQISTAISVVHGELRDAKPLVCCDH